MEIKYLAFAMTVVATSWTTAAYAAECALDRVKDIQPILNANCVSCHQDDAPTADLSLQRGSLVEATVNVNSSLFPDLVLVTPGSSADSYLFHKISGTHEEAGGGGVKMPVDGALRDADIELIRQWIDDCQAG